MPLLLLSSEQALDVRIAGAHPWQWLDSVPLINKYTIAILSDDKAIVAFAFKTRCIYRTQRQR